MAPKPKRAKNKDNARRSKKKISILNQEQVDYIDYKDVNLLRRFMSDRAKIRARRVTGNDAQQQSTVAMAIKNAREMALLPYANRVTQQRGGRDRGSHQVISPVADLAPVHRAEDDRLFGAPHHEPMQLQGIDDPLALGGQHAHAPMVERDGDVE